MIREIYNRLPLPAIVRQNIRKKRTLRTWWKNRETVANWLLGYLWFSSFVLDLARRIAQRFNSAYLSSIRIRYRRGFYVFFPMQHYERKPFMFWALSFDYFRRLRSGAGDSGREIPHDGWLVDIGANVGTFCIPLAAESPSRHILAVEPALENVACLRHSARFNHFDDKHFIVEHAAVAGHDGSVVFDTGQSDTTGHIQDVGFMQSPSAGNVLEVPALRLESLFAKHGITRCDFLKIDCEGSEYMILETLPDQMWDAIDSIYIEIHPVPGKDMKALEKLIESHGYAGKGRARDDGCKEIIYRKLTGEAT